MEDKNLLLKTAAVLEELEKNKWKRIWKAFLKDWRLYFLLVPMVIFLILFKYLPINGILVGFRWDVGSRMSEWAGLYWARLIFSGDYSALFWQAFRNTFVSSMYGLIFGFPIPIFLALLFSEIKNDGYRSIVQVLSYLPHFISTVVVCSIITLWAYEGGTYIGAGILSKFFDYMGWYKSSTGAGILDNPKFFRPIYQISGIWEGAGYGSIVYFAAVMAISPTNYEAAKIDGASKMQQIKYVTMPGMTPTLTIMLIMRIGQILNIGYEKIILLVGARDSAWKTADVVSSFVYRYSGRSQGSSDSSLQQIGIVADLLNAILAMCLVLGANAISRRVSTTSLF